MGHRLWPNRGPSQASLALASATFWARLPRHTESLAQKGDGAWHTGRVAVLCPANTATVRITLGNAGAGDVAFRDVLLSEAAPSGRQARDAGDAPPD